MGVSCVCDGYYRREGQKGKQHDFLDPEEREDRLERTTY